MRPDGFTDAQRKVAVEKSNAIRRERVEMKRKVKDGELALEELLDRIDEPAVGRIRVYDALRSLPGVGTAKAERLMDALGISRSRRLQGLGVRQRESLSAYLAGRK